MRTAALILLTACATTPKAIPRAATCEIDVELVTAPFIGTASNPNDARKTLAQARDAACAALHVASPKTDCDDPLQVVETTRTSFPLQSGVVTQNAEVKLRRVVSLLHKRAEGTASDPLELCRTATASLCAGQTDGQSCFQDGVECNPMDDNSMRCAPVERERVRPAFAPR